MTSEQLATELRERLKTSRQPVDKRPWSEHAHPRGWNDCLDFIDRTIKELMGETGQ